MRSTVSTSPANTWTTSPRGWRRGALAAAPRPRRAGGNPPNNRGAARVAGSPPRGGPVAQEQRLAFGTLVDITIADTDRAVAQQASAAAIGILNTLHLRWHAWEPGPLTDLHRQLAAGATVELAPDQLAALRAAQALAQQSGDLFNPAIGRLVGLWGFHMDERPAGLPPPPPEAVRGQMAATPTLADLRFAGNRVSR